MGVQRGRSCSSSSRSLMRTSLILIIIVFLMQLTLSHLQHCTASRGIYEEMQATPLQEKQLQLQQPLSFEEMRSLIGSSPPKCLKRCGSCSPCRSTLVPIRINAMDSSPFPKPTSESEYYPVVWRCRCGSKLYSP